MPIAWFKIFESKESFENVEFSRPHWNSYLDVTGDCRSDVLIIDESKNIEVWVNFGHTFVYQSSIAISTDVISVFFADMGTSSKIQTTAEPPTSSWPSPTG